MVGHLAGVHDVPTGEIESSAVGGSGAYRRAAKVTYRYGGTMHAVDPNRSPHALCRTVEEPLRLLDQPSTFESWRPGGLGQGSYLECATCADLVYDEELR